MSPFETYQRYLAIKLHFQRPGYDYFKFAGKASTSLKSFEARRDRFQFQRLSKLYNDQQMTQVILANFLVNENCWIGDILSQRGRDIFAEWRKRYQSMQYTFVQDVTKIREYLVGRNLESFDSLFDIDPATGLPPIVSMATQKDIELETFIIIDKILNFIPKISKQIGDNIFWETFKSMCLKYSPFLAVDLKKYKAILRAEFVQKQVARVE